MPYLCPDECGKLITNWTKACFPSPPWDSPGLPPRRMHERCATHVGKPGRSTIDTIPTVLCAYRDDDPARCPKCHTPSNRCSCHITYTSLRVSRCRTCGESWTTPGGFDRHRRYNQCRDPRTLRNKEGQLVFKDAGRKYPCWALSDESGGKWFDELADDKS